MTRKITEIEFQRRFDIARKQRSGEYAFIQANFFANPAGNGEGAWVLITKEDKNIYDKNTPSDTLYGHLCNNLIDIHGVAGDTDPLGGNIGDVVEMATRGVNRPTAKVIEQGFLTS